jgi:hypothetical protein
MRLANVIHWIFFLLALAIVRAAVRDSFDPEQNLQRVFNIVLFLLSGWGIKYALTGRKGFFPWMRR